MAGDDGPRAPRVRECRRRCRHEPADPAPTRRRPSATREVVLARVLEDGEALAAQSCCAVETALQLGADAETIHAYASRQQTVSEHQQRIGEYLRLRAFEAAARRGSSRTRRCGSSGPPRCWLGRAPGSATSTFSYRPSDPVLRRAIGAARHKARTLLTQRMAERLSAPMREGLDALVAVDDDQPHSPLNRIKASSSNPSVGGMKRLLARLELIRRFLELGVSKTAIAKLTGVSRTALYSFMTTRGLRPSR